MVIDIQQPDPPRTDRSNGMWALFAIVLLAIALGGYAVYHVQVVANDRLNREVEHETKRSALDHENAGALVSCGKQCTLALVH
ncbi:hypothetical protein GC177_08800 [bacterium]|nr:hypothetical protein [bacterium]